MNVAADVVLVVLVVLLGLILGACCKDYPETCILHLVVVAARIVAMM